MKRLFGLCALLAALCLAACSDKDTDEPADLVDIKAKLKVNKLWSHGLDGDIHLRLALRPAVADGVVYAAGSDGDVVALSADKGRVLWRVKTKLTLSAGPGVGEDTVVVGDSEGTILALNNKDGAERWRQRLSSEVLAAPAIAKGTVIVRTVDGRLAGLNVADGAARWSVEQTVPRLSLRGTASPTVVGDSVIAGFDNGRVLAVDIASGDTQWDSLLSAPRGKNELERLVDVDAPVRAVGDDVFVVGFQGRLAMLARDSGQIWWAQEFSSYRGFAVNGDELYASHSDGKVAALRRVDGSIAWEQGGLLHRGLTAPALDGDALVVGDYEGYLHWLDKSTGEFVARAKTDGERISNAPISADGRVFIQTDAGKLIAFQTKAKGS